MLTNEPISPRTHPVTFDIGAPRQQELPQVTLPDNRIAQRLDRVEHRLDMIDGALAMLAESLNTGEEPNGRQ